LPNRCTDASVCGDEFVQETTVGYYYADADSKPVGPLSADQVMALYRDGKLNGSSPLFAEGSTTWSTVDTLLRAPQPMQPIPNAYTAPTTRACRSCGIPLAPESKWCGACHASAIPGVYGTLASPGRRLGAYLLDWILPFASIGALVTVVAWSGGGMAAVIAAAALTLAYIVWSGVLFSRGTTPAKNLLGMDVINEDGRVAGFGRMFVREWIGKLIISHMVFCLGLLWIFVDKDRQCWHDKLVSTYVVKRPETM
jgi:uncharacterized RDD family membrane protein YckC